MPAAASATTITAASMESVMEWERHKEMFAWDGSLIDIYVQGTDVADWQRLLDFLRVGPYDLRYIVDEERTLYPLPDQVETIFAGRNTAVALTVDESHLGLICHFFWPDEIEFDLDPRVINGESQLVRLLAFIRTLGRLLGKDVIMTPESLLERPFFRYDPRSGKEDWPIYED